MSAAINLADFVHLAPLISVTVWGCLAVLASALGQDRSLNLGGFAIFGLLFTGVLIGWSWVGHEQAATALFGGMMQTDRFALYLDAVFVIAGIITILVSGPYLREHRFVESEYFGMLLLSISGMMMLVHAENFVMLLIGLETMSLAIYSLVASWPGKSKSAEGGLKYFVMGAVASAILLFGVSMLYGATGTFSLTGLGRAAGSMAGNPLYLFGMYLVLGALAFKVALVPFHMWAPDAYEGAPTPVTGFMASAVKAAGFGILLRVVTQVFGADAFAFGSTGWANIFYTLALLTMTVANLAALRQQNIKRMLAYSSVSHAGYLLMGVITVGMNSAEQGAVLFYLLCYAVTTMGAFAVVAWIGSRDAEHDVIEEWDGLARRHPAVALVFTLFLLSLGGMPPTAGFFAKFYLFKSALAQPGMLLLVVVAALNSVISIFYYLKPVVAMYFKEGAPAPKPLSSVGVYATLAITALLVLGLGLLPGSSLKWAGLSLIGG